MPTAQYYMWGDPSNGIDTISKDITHVVVLEAIKEPVQDYLRSVDIPPRAHVQLEQNYSTCLGRSYWSVGGIAAESERM